MSSPISLVQRVTKVLNEAGEIALNERLKLRPEIKPDGSIVTNADLAVEAFLRSELLALTPGAGFWGEEMGYTAPTEEGFWAVDPVDGTTNFSYGQPIWGITAGYIKNEEIVVGVIVLPDLDEVYVAELGQGGYANGRRIPQIPRGDILQSHLVAHGDSRQRFVGKVPGKSRHIGAFVAEASFVATQRCRAMITGRIQMYDAAAGLLLCRECDAEVRMVSGADFRVKDWLADVRCEPIYVGPSASNFPFGTE
ncbi:inositol monophosphatase family protein [Kamptonema cortianum]|nr:inositol monophosphatase family protein [Kamptonema cortianum]